MPLLSKRIRHAIAESTTRCQQQRSLFPLFVDMTRGVTRLIFRRKCEIANVRAVLHLLRLIEGQHVQRGVALHQLFNVILQQRADHNAGTVLLNLRQNLIDRL
ncbi:hypothetical protein D3C72_1045400 [compost metagenome]